VKKSLIAVTKRKTKRNGSTVHKARTIKERRTVKITHTKPMTITNDRTKNPTNLIRVFRINVENQADG
jgi:hypothetical protein